MFKITTPIHSKRSDSSKSSLEVFAHSWPCFDFKISSIWFRFGLIKQEILENQRQGFVNSSFQKLNHHAFFTPLTVAFFSFPKMNILPIYTSIKFLMRPTHRDKLENLDMSENFGGHGKSGKCQGIFSIVLVCSFICFHNKKINTHFFLLSNF